MLSEADESTAPFEAEDLTNEVSFVSREPEFMGTYSFIYKGAWRGEDIKPVSDVMHTMRRKFRREVTVWAHVKHPNIVPFYGYTEGENSFGPIGSLISPWYCNGDAGTFLKCKGSAIPMDHRIYLWQGVISGVSYLHEQDPQIVHGDLKPGNVLIDDSGSPRICDFGLVHIFMEEQHTGLTTSSIHTGTDRYLAPELLGEDSERPSTASDVWALGCIGLEFLYSVVPYQNRPHNRTGLIFKDIREGVPPATFPADANTRTILIWKWLKECWSVIPNERPDAQELQISLKNPEQYDIAGLWYKRSKTYSFGLRGHTQWVNCVAFSPNGVHIISGSEDATMKLWDMTTGEEVGESFRGHMESVNSVAFSPDGTHVVSASNDMTIRIWDTRTGMTIGTPLIGHTGAVHSVAFSPDGTCIASGSHDATVMIWDAIERVAVQTPFRGHTKQVTSVCFSPDGTKVASGSGDLTMRVWDVTTGQTIGAPFIGHFKWINSIAFSPNGTHIISGSDDHTVRLWDTVTKQEVTAVVYEREIISVAISSDATCIISGADDGKIRVWDISAGQMLCPPLIGHNQGVLCVGFSQDGRHIISGSWDETVRVWEAFNME